MGRKTYESLGKRPLPKRRNIVVTRNPEYGAPGCEVVHSLDEGIRKACAEERIFVIGGGQLYDAALPMAEEIYVTEISDENSNLNLFEPFPGDTYFPPLDEREWDLVRPGKRKFVAANRIVPIPIAQLKRRGLYFRFQKYMRRRSAKGPN